MSIETEAYQEDEAEEPSTIVMYGDGDVRVEWYGREITGGEKDG